MIKCIGHVGISTPDIARLTDFYVNQMGCESLGEAEWPIGTDKIDTVIGLRGSSAKSAMLRLGDVCIELFEFNSPTPATKPNDYPASDHGISHFCFIVEDIQAEYARLSATGMSFHSEPKSLCARPGREHHRTGSAGWCR
jgi:catechol 2,3-dioxygenase-like lactoylglutathione lyase family enzyme